MVSVWRAFSPRWAAVSITVAMVAKAAAPHSERKPPLTLRWTTDLRKARSQASREKATGGPVVRSLAPFPPPAP